MAKIRNKSGMTLDVPGHGIVEADTVIEVADAEVYGFTCQSIWEPSGKAAQDATNAGEKAEQALTGSVDPEPVPDVPSPPDAA